MSIVSAMGMLTYRSFVSSVINLWFLLMQSILCTFVHKIVSIKTFKIAPTCFDPRESQAAYHTTHSQAHP